MTLPTEIVRRRPVEPEPPSAALVREDLPPCKYFLSTGSTLLDLAISGRCPGGVGSGRITHFYGGNSTAKSVLVQEVLGSAQRAGGSAVYEDAEHTLDLPRAESLHDLKNGTWKDEAVRLPMLDKKIGECLAICTGFVYRTPTLLETWWDEDVAGACKLIETGKLARPCAMAVDSISALPSMAEVDADLTDASYGQSRPKVNSQAFRVYIHPIAAADLTIVAVDQTRDSIGKISFGPPKPSVSGGHAIEFYASTRVELNHAGNLLNKFKQVVGVRIRFKVTKNKLAPPFREGLLHILFDYGVDDLSANLEWMHGVLYPKGKAEKKKGRAVQAADEPEEEDEPADEGLAEALCSKLRVRGSWWYWGECAMGHGMDAAVRKVEEDGSEQEVRDEVVRLWQALYAPAERKPRRRD